MFETSVNIRNSNTTAVLLLNTLRSRSSDLTSTSMKCEQSTPQEDGKKDRISHVIVRGILGTSYVIEIKRNCLVMELKKKLAEKEVISPNCVCLSYRGQTLKDHQCLSDCGVENGSLIQSHICVMNSAFLLGKLPL
jgi:hypothetical protein